jgi:hypothetical protein
MGIFKLRRSREVTRVDESGPTLEQVKVSWSGPLRPDSAIGDPEEQEWLDYVQSMVTSSIGRSPEVHGMWQDLQTLSWQYRLLKKQSQWTALYGLALTIYGLFLRSELRRLRRLT